MFALWADVGRLSQNMSKTRATDEVSTQLWKHEQDSGHRRKSVAVLCGCDTSSISLLLCSHWREVSTSVSHDKSKSRITAKHDVCVRCVKPRVSYGFSPWRCDQGYRALQKHGMCDGVEYTNSIRIENHCVSQGIWTCAKMRLRRMWRRMQLASPKPSHL